MAIVGPAAGATVALPVQLVWHALPGALEYRVTVLAAGGTRAFATATTDTALTVGATQGLGGDVAYNWFVSALTKTGAEIRSPVRNFRVRTP